MREHGCNPARRRKIDIMSQGGSDLLFSVAHGNSVSKALFRSIRHLKIIESVMGSLSGDRIDKERIERKEEGTGRCVDIRAGGPLDGIILKIFIVGLFPGERDRTGKCILTDAYSRNERNAGIEQVERIG